MTNIECVSLYASIGFVVFLAYIIILGELTLEDVISIPLVLMAWPFLVVLVLCGLASEYRNLVIWRRKDEYRPKPFDW